MRISDWSSDVCSSDLGSASVPRRFAIGDEVAKDAGRAADAARPVDEVEEIAAAHTRSELFDDHDVAVARQAGTAALQGVAIDAVAARPKLGRASCRERWCPYVWTSVVAVTIKK